MAASGVDRRAHVLDAALLVFARHGYRRTSMEEVARVADISRPGLYFHFSSKPDLLRAAVERALEEGLDAARRALAESGRPLRDRLVDAFDAWSGRFAGPPAAEIDALLDDNPELLGAMPTEYPRRFAAIVTDALRAAGPELPVRPGVTASDVTGTLVSTARGIKHDAGGRAEFRARMAIAVDLYCTAATPG